MSSSATLFTALRAMCFGIIFAGTHSIAFAAPDTNPLPRQATVEKDLNALEKRESLSETEVSQRDALRRTLRSREEISRNKNRLNELTQEQQQAPQKLEQLKQEQKDHQPFSGDPNPFASEDISSVVKALTSALDALQSKQEQLARTSSKLINYQTLPEQAQTTLRQALMREDEVRQEINHLSKQESDTADYELSALRAEREALNSRIDLRQRELWSSDNLRRVSAAEKQVLQSDIDYLEAKIELLQETLNSKRQLRTENLIASASSDIPSSVAGNTVLENIASINRQLSKRVVELSHNTNELIRDNIEIRTQLDRLRQNETNLNEQIDVLQGSLILSRILYSTQKSLPLIDINENLGESIDDLRLEQFRIHQRQSEQVQPSEEAPRLLHENDPNATPSDELVSAVEKQLAVRSELRDQLEAELSRYLDLAIGIQVGQEQLLALSRSLRATVREQSFWMPSNQVLDINWWKNLPSTLVSQWQDMQPIPKKNDWKTLFLNGVGSGIPLFLIACLLWLRRNHWKKQLGIIEGEIGRVQLDSQAHTPRALLLDVLLELPVPLFICAFGLMCLSVTPAWAICASSLFRLALMWLVFALCIRILRPHGMAENHFHWPRETSSAIRKWVIVTGVGMLAPTVISAIEIHRPELLPDNVIAMLFLMGSSVITGIGLFQVFRTYPLKLSRGFLRNAVATVALLIPISLLLMTWLGYFYSAVKLSGRLTETFYLLLLWVLLSQSAVRGLAVAARRLKFKRALAKRQAAKDEHQEGTDAPVEEPPLDMDQVNQQSLRLTRIALMSIFAVVFYWVWSDLLGTFSYMDTITLWQTSTGEGDLAQWVPVSLGDVIAAVIIIVFTVALARNLPGLLEVLVLSRLTLRAGSSYAITTLLSYVILSVGFVSGLSAIGFAWSKLQWLVAALGVGLGFGLQEIFANFVSGLIILFERPARIGDVITIGDLSGTVSRIRIRATTITDFERKEIIVPNKNFVTDRLINWSLTDSITRITVTVGFAYGSDLDKAYDVLMQAARENKLVLKDPEPVALFLSFGASTLDHELRVHVKEVADRLPATNALNRRIDALCREHGLEIAFSQLDIHIRSNDGEELSITPNQKDPEQS